MRPISTSERFCAKFGYIVIASQLEGDLHLSLFENACKKAYLRHPLLRCKMVYYGHEPWFEEIQKPALSVIIEENIDSNEDRNRLFQEVLKKQPPLNESLFSVVIGQSSLHPKKSHVYLLVSHAICDGLSAVNLTIEILQEYEALFKNTPSIMDPLDLLPPADYYIDNEIARRKHQGLITSFKQKPSPTPEVLRPVLSVGDIHQTHMSVIQRKFDQRQTQRLASAVKRNQTSIHGAICSAQLLATYSLLSKDDSTEKILSCHSPINMRSIFSPPLHNAHLMNAASGTIQTYSISKKTDFWELAKKIQNDIRQDIKTGYVFLRLKELPSDCSIPHSFHVDDIPWEPLLLSGTVTNIGKINASSHYGNVKLLEIDFSVTRYDGKMCTAVSGFGEEIVFNFLYTYPVYDAPLVKELADLTLSLLENA